MVTGSPTPILPSLGALTGGLLGSLAAVLLVGTLEITDSSQLAAAVGLLSPIALVVGGSLALWTLAIHGSSRLSLGLVLESSKRRFRLGLLGPFLLLAWWTLGQLVVHGAPRLGLAPARSGVVVAGVSLVLLWLGGVALEQLATLLSRRVSRPSLLLCLGALVLSVAGGIALLVSVGRTSGTGGVFALFGVLKRDELDLRPALGLLLLSGTAYLGAAWGTRFGAGRRALLALGGMLVAAAAGLASARALQPRAAVTFERNAGLTGALLLAYQRLDDRDHDGAAAHFGGGDCNDRDTATHPGAVDVPGNGLDEDCSGADTPPRTHATSAQKSAVTAARAALASPFNVVLLTIDTLRYDLGYTRPGSSRPLSPQLDRLAQESTVFDNAYSLASYTSKSLGPALIGRYPSETSRNFDHFDRFSPDVPFLAERLQKAGVATLSVQGYWYFFTPGYGFERGFGVIDKQAAPRVISVDADGSSNGDKVGARLVQAVEGLKDETKPFFLWGHWVDPHAEYVKHDEFDFGRESRDRYDGEVAFVDKQVGLVLEALRQSPHAARTVVIVSSDHGEAFGEHGLIRHGFEVWEELVRVPLIVHVPGAAPSHVKERRSAIDLVPTVLEAMKVEPSAAPSEFLRGQSLLQDVYSLENRATRPVLVDMPAGPHNKERRAFYSGTHKLITSDGRVLGLYDLAKDPEEKHDLSEDAALCARLEGEQASFLAGLVPLAAKR